MRDAVEILVLCGSLRAQSTTHHALEVAAEAARDEGARIIWADLWVGELPPYAEENADHPAVRELLQAAERADGFLWGSPEYHGTCSGLLKNALDYLYFPQTEGKVAALVATSGGAGGAAGTLITLRTVARSLHLWTLPSQVSAASGDLAGGEGGAGGDAAVLRRLTALGRELVAATRLLGPAPPRR